MELTSVDPISVIILAAIAGSIAVIVDRRRRRRADERAQREADVARSIRESHAQEAFVPTIPLPPRMRIRPSPAEVSRALDVVNREIRGAR